MAESTTIPGSNSKFLALDPGVTTGWAIFEKGEPTAMGETPFEEIYSFLTLNPVGLYVIEDYIIRAGRAAGGFAHQWNKGEALRIIGAVELLAEQKKAVVVKQQPSIKPIAAKMTGVPYTPGKAGTHMFDAILHGRYFWMKENPSAPHEDEASGGDTDEARVRPPARVTQISSFSGLRKAGNSSGMGVQGK